MATLHTTGGHSSGGNDNSGDGTTGVNAEGDITSFFHIFARFSIYYYQCQRQLHASLGLHCHPIELFTIAVIQSEIFKTTD